MALRHSVISHSVAKLWCTIRSVLAPVVPKRQRNPVDMARQQIWLDFCIAFLDIAYCRDWNDQGNPPYHEPRMAMDGRQPRTTLLSIIVIYLTIQRQMKQNLHHQHGKFEQDYGNGPFVERCHGPQAASPDWQFGLSAAWQTLAITPCRFAIHRDDDIPATRTLGYDEDDNPCYCRQTFLRGSLRMDEDDFYEAFDYSEEVHAWRLCDTRWLICRRVRREGDCRAGRDRYSFSEFMPR